MASRDAALARAAAYGRAYRKKVRPVHPHAGAEALREMLCVPLPENGVDGASVIEELITAVEPGLVGNTDGSFYAWVMGGSDMTGVAADWLTSVWGQNAAIYQTAPAAAIAEEAVAAWLLDLLDLPRTSSVGLVTGATMAGFVCLAAARSEVLRRFGHDIERDGLHGAPLVRIYLSEDAHVSNHAALRFLGFGDANLVLVPSDPQGVMHCDLLAQQLAAHDGPKIIIGQAGHINSGGFDDFAAIGSLANAHAAWLHVDGAFGLWARVLAEKEPLTRCIECADSWSVDGHKWLQIPYDSGFAIVKDAEAHRRAMDISASYLTHSERDGRNPTEFNPELSRRARGFAAWAVIRSLGRSGLQSLVRRHCRLASQLAEKLARVPGITVVNRVDSNQVVLQFSDPDSGLSADQLTQQVADRINASGRFFLRTTTWKSAVLLRISVISGATDEAAAAALADAIATEWGEVRNASQASGGGTMDEAAQASAAAERMGPV